jgi:hypothetical protein
MSYNFVDPHGLLVWTRGKAHWEELTLLVLTRFVKKQFKLANVFFSNEEAIIPVCIDSSFN